MQLILHHKNAVNITQTERWISAVGGGLLAAMGLKSRSATGLALALVGGDLLRRSITGHSYFYEAIGIRTAPLGQGAETTSVPYELGIRVDRSVTIARPRSEVYQFWRNLGNLPRFMKHVESVRVDGLRSHWVVRAPGNRTVAWEAVIHNEIENELLAWRSLRGADVDHAGSVLFRDAPGGRGTEITVELQYNPPAGMIGAAVATLWGEEPSIQIQEDLQRLKQYLEAGEIIGTDGAAEAARRDRAVQIASEASFPASDAPAYY